MFEKIFRTHRDTNAGLQELLAEAGVAPRPRERLGRMLTAVGASVIAVALIGGGVLAFAPLAATPSASALRAAAEGAEAAGFGFGGVALLGAIAAAAGILLARLDRLARDMRRAVEELPDPRPSIEGLAARQRQILGALETQQQRIAALPASLHGMLSGGLQSIEIGVEARLAALEERMLERLDALHAGQPTEALWRLAASLDRLGHELERRIERRLGEHADGLDQRLSELIGRARAALAEAPARPAEPRVYEPVVAATPDVEAPAPAPVVELASPPPPARKVGTEPSLAAQLRSFDPAENDHDEREAELFDLEAPPSPDLYGDVPVLDLGRLEEELAATIDLLDQSDPFAAPAQPARDPIDAPPAALPHARKPAQRPAAAPLERHDGGPAR